MDEFLSSWEENCTSEKDRLKDLESQITQTLNKIGKQQSLMQLVPRYANILCTHYTYFLTSAHLN